jgi:Ser/Thr protein kinase RdoA (MazF antagonist)
MGSSEASAAAVGETGPARARLAVVQSVIRPSSVLESLGDRHALDAPVECRLLRPGLNDTYLVTSRRGRHVARVYGAHRRPSEIGYELELLLHLGAGGVSVSEPIPTADGCLTCVLDAPEGLRELALFRHTGGSAISWRDEQHCRLAGRLAATIHGGADGFVTEHDRSSLDLEELADASLRAVQPFFAHRPEDWSFMVGLADVLRANLARALDDGLDWGACHGDFGAKNIHVAGGALTVIDFDLCGPGWRAYDLAPVYRAAREAGEPKLWEAFVRGYTD